MKVVIDGADAAAFCLVAGASVFSSELNLLAVDAEELFDDDLLLDDDEKKLTIYSSLSAFLTAFLNILSMFCWASLAFFSNSSLLIMWTTGITINAQGFISWV